MTKAWRLTEQAEESLVEIAEWTIDHFGVEQAEIYQAELIDRCAGIASGSIFTRDCSVLIGEPSGSGLRYARAGEHFVIFVEERDRVVIVDFLHGRSDLPRLVRSIEGQLDRRK